MIKKLLKPIKDRLLYLIWLLKGKPIPANGYFKRKRIIDLAKKYNCDTFIETGTYVGNTLLAVEKYFDKLISIELSEEIHKNNLIKFKNHSKILLFQGDSSEKMKEMLNGVKGKCLFWLDGHYSDGITAKGILNCPILGEIEAIKDHKISDAIILIDDAREFTGNNDYPKLKEVIELLKQINSHYTVSVSNDCIIAIP
jgi:hypothetical protein